MIGRIFTFWWCCMKMINPRSGHSPSFDSSIIYMMLGAFIGWPIAIPVFFFLVFLYDEFKIDYSNSVFFIVYYFGVIVGTYVHYHLLKATVDYFLSWWTS